MIFKRYHIAMIRDGSKIHTRRLWQKPRVKVGNTYCARVNYHQPRRECPLFVVQDLYQQRLGDMTEEDAWKEGRYTLAQFKGVWKEINGTWDDNQVPWVIVIKYVGEGSQEV